MEEEDYNGLNIKSWAEEDRPREKLLEKGKTTLSNAELISLLIGSGNQNETAVELSRKVLGSVNNNLVELGKRSVDDLRTFHGIGKAKAISIVAALELGHRRKSSEGLKRIKVSSSVEVYEHICPFISDLPHEEFWVILLNKANMILSRENISKGGVSGTVADTKIIFKKAIQNLASSIILCHNHPSGNLNPSQADINLTKKLKAAGELLDIYVLDHLIVSDNGYYSFADEGMF